jgi:hypothetical protein
VDSVKFTSELNGREVIISASAKLSLEGGAAKAGENPVIEIASARKRLLTK